MEDKFYKESYKYIRDLDWSNLTKEQLSELNRMNETGHSYGGNRGDRLSYTIASKLLYILTSTW